MGKLRSLFKEIPERTLSGVKALIHTKPPFPTEEEFISPLRKALKAHMATKEGIAYGENCAYCRQQGAVDTQIKDAVDSSEDPEPYLIELYKELVQTREALAVTTTELGKTRRFYTPSNRVKWAIYGAFATGGAMATLRVLEWLVPLLIP